MSSITDTPMYCLCPYNTHVCSYRDAVGPTQSSESRSSTGSTQSSTSSTHPLFTRGSGSSFGKLARLTGAPVRVPATSSPFEPADERLEDTFRANNSVNHKPAVVPYAIPSKATDTTISTAHSVVPVAPSIPKPMVQAPQQYTYSHKPDPTLSAPDASRQRRGSFSYFNQGLDDHPDIGPGTNNTPSATHAVDPVHPKTSSSVIATHAKPLTGDPLHASAHGATARRSSLGSLPAVLAPLSGSPNGSSMQADGLTTQPGSVIDAAFASSLSASYRAGVPTTVPVTGSSASSSSASLVHTTRDADDGLSSLAQHITTTDAGE